MQIKYKIWIEKDGKPTFGRGRANILKMLHHEHSLNAAAKKLGISFRGAWGRIKVSEERLGIKLTAMSADRRSSSLTDDAQALLKRFEKLEKDMNKIIHAADQDFEKLLLNQEP